MASKPAITVKPMLDEDVPVVFDLISKSFGHDSAFLDLWYPEHWTPSGAQAGSKRFLEWKQKAAAAGKTVFLKAVRTGDNGRDGEIAGMAVWTHAREAPSLNLDELVDVKAVWPDEEDAELMRRMWPALVKGRTEAMKRIGDVGVHVLDYLAVHPDHQRLGAGQALVKWGTDYADEHGLEAMLEGTPKGVPTYKKCGFRTIVESVEFDLGERFEHRPKPVVAFMTRDAKVRQNVG